MSKPVITEHAVSIATRDEVRIRLSVNDEGLIQEAQLMGVGCPELLNLLVEWRSRLTGQLNDVPLPEGTGHAAVLMREILLKAQGRWKFPYADEELCHCRAVPTVKVDAAIVGGCHTLESIRRATSACTSCGSCRPDIEAILAYRLGKVG